MRSLQPGIRGIGQALQDSFDQDDTQTATVFSDLLVQLARIGRTSAR